MTLLPSHVIPLPLFSKEGHPEPNVTALRRKTLFLGFSSLNTYPFPGPRKSWDMSRKRHRLVPETFGLKKRREQVPIEAVPVRGESGNHGNPGMGQRPQPGAALAPVTLLGERQPRSRTPPRFLSQCPGLSAQGRRALQSRSWCSCSREACLRTRCRPSL